MTIDLEKEIDNLQIQLDYSQRALNIARGKNEELNLKISDLEREREEVNTILEDLFDEMEEMRKEKEAQSIQKSLANQKSLKERLNRLERKAVPHSLSPPPQEKAPQVPKQVPEPPKSVYVPNPDPVQLPLHPDPDPEIERRRESIKEVRNDLLHSFKHQTSNIKHQTSNIKHQTSNIKQQTSEIKHQRPGIDQSSSCIAS